MPEEELTTKMGKWIIPVELLGRNIVYTVLKNPIDPAYPQGDEIRYLDYYVSKLNELYSLSDILGEKRQEIAKGNWDEIKSIVANSPLQNYEGERTLGHMLISSAKAGELQPFVIDVLHLTGKKIEMAKDHLDGLGIAQLYGFALRVGDSNKLIVVPSQSFIEYVAQKIIKE